MTKPPGAGSSHLASLREVASSASASGSAQERKSRRSSSGAGHSVPDDEEDVARDVVATETEEDGFHFLVAEARARCVPQRKRSYAIGVEVLGALLEGREGAQGRSRLLESRVVDVEEE
jgi:hypothetical protein